MEKPASSPPQWDASGTTRREFVERERKRERESKREKERIKWSAQTTRRGGGWQVSYDSRVIRVWRIVKTGETAAGGLVHVDRARGISARNILREIGPRAEKAIESGRGWGGAVGWSAKRKADHVDGIPWCSLTTRRTELNQSRKGAGTGSGRNGVAGGGRADLNN
jgi:hypothetical protein